MIDYLIEIPTETLSQPLDSILKSCGKSNFRDRGGLKNKIKKEVLSEIINEISKRTKGRTNETIIGTSLLTFNSTFFYPRRFRVQQD